MIKVVCVGCSWTDGFEEFSYKETYPHIIKERHPDWKVYNLGLRGANNFFINMVLEQALRDIEPDFVVRQVTTWNRWMTYDDRIQLHYDELEPGYWHSNLDAYSNTVMWTAGSLCHPNYYDAKYYDKIRQHHYEHMPEQFSLELEEAALTKTEKLLRDTPHTLLFWKDNTSKLANPDWWKYYPCIERDIGFSDAVDSGKHFLRDGNTKVADLLIENIQIHV
jgi:hypothetical protein